MIKLDLANLPIVDKSYLLNEFFYLREWEDVLVPGHYYQIELGSRGEIEEVKVIEDIDNVYVKDFEDLITENLPYDDEEELRSIFEQLYIGPEDAVEWTHGKTIQTSYHEEHLLVFARL